MKTMLRTLFAIALSIAGVLTSGNARPAYGITEDPGTLRTSAEGQASAASLAAGVNSALYLPLVFNNYNPVFTTLANGGTYIGAGGVGLGALANSLSAPIAVAITQTAAP